MDGSTSDGGAGVHFADATPPRAGSYLQRYAYPDWFAAHQARVGGPGDRGQRQDDVQMMRIKIPQGILSGEQLDALVDAVADSGLCAVVVYPNNDPGSDAIIGEYEAKMGSLTTGMILRFDGPNVVVDIGRGQAMGLVGESGSGKSMTGYSILGLIDPPGRIVAGSIRLDGAELTNSMTSRCRSATPGSAAAAPRAFAR